MAQEIAPAFRLTTASFRLPISLSFYLMQKDALRMKRVINRYDIHHVVSFTAAVFSFTITKKTAKNIDGWTNLQCSRCQIFSINDVSEREDSHRWMIGFRFILYFTSNYSAR